MLALLVLVMVVKIALVVVVVLKMVVLVDLGCLCWGDRILGRRRPINGGRHGKESKRETLPIYLLIHILLGFA